MHIRLCFLISIALAVINTSAAANDHLKGKVIAVDRDQGTVVVRPDHDRDKGGDVTMRMKSIPPELQTGSLVRARGRFLGDDRTRFEASRLKIRHDDPSGVRSRLHHIPSAEHEQSHPVIRIPDTFKIPERSR